MLPGCGHFWRCWLTSATTVEWLGVTELIVTSTLMGGIGGMLTSWLYSFCLSYGPISWRLELEMI